MIRILVVLGVLAAVLGNPLVHTKGSQTIAEADIPSVREWLQRCDLVFAGRLVEADWRGSCVSGIAPCFRRLSFEVDEELRGRAARKRQRIEVVMLGPSSWVERNPKDGMLSFSRSFFHEGSAYLVLAERSMPSEGLESDEFVVTGSQQIWPATAENVAMLRRLVTEPRKPSP